MKHIRKLILTLFSGMLFIQVPAQKPVVEIKSNLINLLLKTSGLEAEIYTRSYFSISAAWYNTGGITAQNFWWIGNVYSAQANYFFRNNMEKGTFFSILAQSGKWYAYNNNDKHKIAEITTFGGGILFGKKWIISKSKHWLLEPRIGYKQTISLQKKKVAGRYDYR